MKHRENASGEAGRHDRKRGRWSRAAACCAATFFVLFVVGLVLHTGTGTPSSFGIDAVTAVCPLGALEAMVGNRGAPVHLIVAFAAVVALVLVFGKAFCSWVCPVSYIRSFFRSKKASVREDAAADACDQLSEIVSPCQGCVGGDKSCSHAGCALPAVDGKRDGLQLDGRHAVLVGAVGSAAIFGFPVFCLVCPVGLTFAFGVAIWHLFHFGEMGWTLVVAPVVLLLEVVVLKRWCSTLCPISALMSLISQGNKTVRPAVDSLRCLRERGVDCHACVEVCPEQLDPHSRRIPECTKCGKCADACPVRAIALKLRS